MRRVVLGLLAYVEFGVIVVAWLPFLGFLAWRHREDPTRRIPGRSMRKLGRTITRFSPVWRFTVDGPVPSDINDRAYVVVANHQSNADPFLLAKLRWDMRWIAKEELARWPIAGWAFRWGGDILFRRGHRPSIVRMMEQCAETLDHGLSLMIFPEGTRSRTGDLLPFKDGAFSLAIDKQVPLLPVVLHGTRACIPKGSRWFGEARAHARVLEPIETEGLTKDDLPVLRERARDAIAAAQRKLRDEMPELSDVELTTPESEPGGS
jgi:1-acyl-sn-glycerol-3-phosphate acyltransferase